MKYIYIIEFYSYMEHIETILSHEFTIDICYFKVDFIVTRGNETRMICSDLYEG